MLLKLLENALHFLPAVLAALAIAGVLTFAVAHIQHNRTIHRYGGRAPKIPSHFFGLPEAKRAIESSRANRDLELWKTLAVINGTLTHTHESNILWQRIVYTEDPENIKALLATQFADYGKGENFHQQWKPFLGDSVFVTDGRVWSDSRQLIRPQFVKERLSDLHIFERHVQRMLHFFPADGTTFDISDLFFRFTLDSATDFLLGCSVDSLASPMAEFAQAFAQIQEYMNDTVRVGPFRTLLPKRQFNKNLRTLNAFVEPFVEATLALKREDLKNKKEAEYNFLHGLAEFTRDRQVLRDQLVAVLLAARDTTAGTLSWCFFEMSKRKDCVDRLREEILGRLGRDTKPTYADLKDMRYLQNVVNETLRLYPAVPFNLRTSLRDTYLPHGSGPSGLDPVGIAKDTYIIYSTLAMQRREDLFGPDVNEFKPERWDTWTPKPWNYVPFNGGPRICIGQQFALTELAYTLVRLFQTIEIVEDRQSEEQLQRCAITISPTAGVKISVKRT